MRFNAWSIVFCVVAPVVAIAMFGSVFFLVTQLGGLYAGQ